MVLKVEKAAFDWEIPHICSLMEMMGRVLLNGNQVDKRGWTGSSKGCCPVKSCYILVDSSRDMGIPWKAIWNHMMPLKVQFFLWTTALGKISTIDILSHKGMYLTNICLLCYKDEESISHLLIHYPFVSDVWNALLRDFGMNWIASPDVNSFLASWRSSAFISKGKMLWSMVSASIWWSVWKERNNRVFNNYAEPSSQVYKKAKSLLLF